MHVDIHATAPLVGVERMVKKTCAQPSISLLHGSRATGAGPGEEGWGRPLYVDRCRHPGKRGGGLVTVKMLRSCFLMH